MTTSLLDIFMPPEKHFGDFGMFCGYTASQQVLRRIKRHFSGDTSRPVLAAFIHPTKAPITDVPGLAWIAMGAKNKKRDFGLLHAKVALLGFRALEGDGYTIRLAVTTGNWTADPLSTSIDLFWQVDLDTEKAEPQIVSDVRAAWELFEWLRKRGDCGVLDRHYHGQAPDGFLRKRIAALPKSERRARFIDNRTEGLLPQVVARLEHNNSVADRLIIGSGYYESGSSRALTVPEKLLAALVETNAMDAHAKPELVLNPDNCQSMAVAGKKLQTCGWELRRPVSDVHKGNDMKLHAKFALLATGEGNDPCIGRLYLGSGNMTPAGFENAVRAKGNLEAGVVFDLPDGMQWRRNGQKAIRKWLPIGDDGGAILANPALSSGEDFERIEEPDQMPEVAWLEWRDGCLHPPTDGPVEKVEIFGPKGARCSTPCHCYEAPPLRVTLCESGWTVPVIADGALVTPKPIDLTVEDIIAKLTGFPAVPDQDSVEDGAEDEYRGEPDATQDRPASEDHSYAIRRMMRLLTPLSVVQSNVAPCDWPRWCKELRDDLCAVAEQEKPMLDFFRAAKANPLPILADPQIIPEGMERAEMVRRLDEVAERWDMADMPSLWDKDTAK